MRMLLLILIVSSLSSSCLNVKKLQYLQEPFDTTSVARATYPSPIIQKNDLLDIKVYSDNALASSYYNTTTSYLVDKNGRIFLSGVGELQVAGLTKKQLYELLLQTLSSKLNNPYFDIRFRNYKIYILGEVNQPGQYDINDERVTIMEAIGMAGDLTAYGIRDGVRIIRENSGKKEFATLNLKSANVMTSPYYYLMPGDVVYVMPNKAKASEAKQQTAQYITTAATIITLAVTVISLLN